MSAYPEHYVSEKEVFLLWEGCEVRIPKGDRDYDQARFLVYTMRWKELYELALGSE